MSVSTPVMEHGRVVANTPIPYSPDMLQGVVYGRAEAALLKRTHIIADRDNGVYVVAEGVGRGRNARESAKLLAESIHSFYLGDYDPSIAPDTIADAASRYGRDRVSEAAQRKYWRNRNLGAVAAYMKLHPDADGMTSAAYGNVGTGTILRRGTADTTSEMLATGGMEQRFLGRDRPLRYVSGRSDAYDTYDPLNKVDVVPVRSNDRFALLTHLPTPGTAEGLPADAEVSRFGQLRARIARRLGRASVAASERTSGNEVLEAMLEVDPETAANRMHRHIGDSSGALVVDMPAAPVLDPDAGPAVIGPRHAAVDDDSVRDGGMRVPVVDRVVDDPVVGVVGDHTSVDGDTVAPPPTRRQRWYQRPGNVAMGGLGSYMAFTDGRRNRRHGNWRQKMVAKGYTEEDIDRRIIVRERSRVGLGLGIAATLLAYRFVADPGNDVHSGPWPWWTGWHERTDHGMDLLGGILDHGDRYDGDGHGFDVNMLNDTTKGSDDPANGGVSGGTGAAPHRGGVGPGWDYPANPGGSGGTGGGGSGNQTSYEEAIKQPFTLEPNHGPIVEFRELAQRVLGHPLPDDAADHMYYNMPEELRRNLTNIPEYKGPTPGDWRFSRPAVNVTWNQSVIDYLNEELKEYA